MYSIYNQGNFHAYTSASDATSTYVPTVVLIKNKSLISRVAERRKNTEYVSVAKVITKISKQQSEMYIFVYFSTTWAGGEIVLWL